MLASYSHAAPGLRRCSNAPRRPAVPRAINGSDAVRATREEGYTVAVRGESTGGRCPDAERSVGDGGHTVLRCCCYPYRSGFRNRHAAPLKRDGLRLRLRLRLWLRSAALPGIEGGQLLRGELEVDVEVLRDPGGLGRLGDRGAASAGTRDGRSGGRRRAGGPPRPDGCRWRTTRRRGADGLGAIRVLVVPQDGEQWLALPDPDRRDPTTPTQPSDQHPEPVTNTAARSGGCSRFAHGTG